MSPIEMKAANDWALDTCFQLIPGHVEVEGEREQVLQSWQQPPLNCVKVNVDGAFVEASNVAVVGAVARNEGGEFLMAITRRLTRVASALFSEAEALRAGVQMIHSVTSGPVIMETDSLELVNLWKHRATQRSEFGQILQDIQDLASSFASFSVMYARRTANRVAHACAQFAASSLFEVWTNVPSSFLQQILQDDCNHATE
jgi:ribonuclease HI